MDRPRAPTREELAAQLTPEALRRDHLIVQAQSMTGELLANYRDPQEQIDLAAMVYAAVLAHTAAPGRIEDLIAYAAHQLGIMARTNYSILQERRAEAAKERR